MQKNTELDVSGYLRQARRRTGMSQREFAAACDIGVNTISRAEARRTDLKVNTLARLLRAAELRMVVVDADLRRVPPIKELPATRDLGDRRFPAHLPLILDPGDDEWWGTHFNLVRPPETFRRDPAARYAHRLVFSSERGVLDHCGPLDWRERVRLRRELFDRAVELRAGRYATGEIPWRRRAGSGPTHPMTQTLAGLELERQY